MTAGSTDPRCGGTVEGAVRGFDGAALRNVGVTLTDAGGLQVARTSSDADGYFRLVARAPGTHLLICNAAGFAPSVCRVELTGHLLVRDIVLSGNCALSGRIRDGDVAVPATVTLIDDTGATVASTTTGRRGTYQFKGLRAGHYVVAASAAGAQPTVRPIEVTGEDALDVVLEPSHGLTGTVTAADGIPLGGALVVLATADGRELACVAAGPDGHFEMDQLPAGTFVLTASTRSEVRSEVNTSIPTELDVSVPPPGESARALQTPPAPGSAERAASGPGPAERAASAQWHVYGKPESGRRRARRGREPFRPT